MGSTRLLDVAECDRVVYLHAPRAAAPADAARLAADLADACRSIEERVEPPAGVALIGGGGGFFLRPPRDAADLDAVGTAWAAATEAVARLGPPTIAVIGADALGPAWELALACDLRVAAAEARVGSPEVRWGRLPSAGGSQRLARIVGPAGALGLLLLAERLDASAALARGLVHRVAPAAELEAAAETLLDGLRGAAPIALAYAKEAAHAATELPLAAGLRLEADLASLLQTTSDRAEGLAAYHARRPPHFTAR